MESEYEHRSCRTFDIDLTIDYRSDTMGCCILYNECNRTIDFYRVTLW